jgi:hypothetical protein
MHFPDCRPIFPGRAVSRAARSRLANRQLKRLAHKKQVNRKEKKQMCWVDMHSRSSVPAPPTSTESQCSGPTVPEPLAVGAAETQMQLSSSVYFVQ